MSKYTIEQLKEAFQSGKLKFNSVVSALINIFGFEHWRAVTMVQEWKDEN